MDDELMGHLSDRDRDARPWRSIADQASAVDEANKDVRRAKRHAEQSAARQDRDTIGRVLGELLPSLDLLDRACDHAEGGDPRLLADIRQVQSAVASALLRLGVERVGQPGDLFDPNIHEAVGQDPTAPSGVIGAVYQHGLRLGDQLLRPACVTVGVI